MKRATYIALVLIVPEPVSICSISKYQRGEGEREGGTGGGRGEERRGREK